MKNDRQPDPLQSIRAELIGIIEEVLGEALPAVPRDTPILDFVLSSLALVEGMRRIYEHFGVLVSIRRVIEGQATLDGIAAYIYQELQEQVRPQTPETGVAERPDGKDERTLPLAPTQQHVGFLFKYSPTASAAFNTSIAVELLGPLDAPALQSALDSVVERYEALRTSFDVEADRLRIHTHHPLEFRITPVPENALEAGLARASGRPFASGERLFRAEIFRTPAGRHVLVLAGHELLLDREALDVVLEDLAGFYSAYTRNETPQPGFPALQWSDYLAMGDSPALEPVRAAGRGYWLNQLDEIPPPLEFPTDRLRPAVKDYAGARIVRSLVPEMSAALSSSRNAGAAVLTAYVLFLARLSGRQDIVAGVRSSPLYLDSVRRVAGPVRTMLPVQFRPDLSGSFRLNLDAALEVLREADRHRNFSLSELIRAFRIPRDQSRSPLFTFAFTHHQPGRLPEFAGLKADRLEIPAPGARYDLALTVIERGAEFSLVCDFSTELLDAATVSNWLDGLTTLLQAGLLQPDLAAGELPLMTGNVRRTVLEEWNRTETGLPLDETVLDLFLRQVSAHPEAPAVRQSGVSVSYAELAGQVEVLAARMVEAGVRPKDRVAILLDRSPEMLAAILAVWRAGAQYVPLDQKFPQARLAYMLEDCGAALLVCTPQLSRLAEDFPEEKTLRLGVGPETPGSRMQAARVSQADPAYIIYTSGSTGQPKGVQVGHRSLLNLLLDVGEQLSFKRGDSFLAATTISFDISGLELFLPLIRGGTVEMAPDDVIGDGLRMVEYMEASRPGFVQQTPSFWNIVLSAGWQGDPKMVLCAAGERLNRKLVEDLLQKGAALWNLYGPTETTIYSAIERLSSDPEGPVSIGRPVANNRLYVLDERRQPVPPGFVGELYIGGEGLAFGYWQRPDLTDQSFVPDPFRPGEKIYRTGDLARFLPDGRLLCLGRIDDQVKVHGVRIEPGEIEAAMRSLAGIKDAVVTIWQDESGSAQLVGHLVATQDPPPSRPEIRAALRETLPEVMVPPYLMFHTAFPLTENGKVRRSALPAPDREGQIEAQRTSPPETETERVLAAAWAQVLQIAPQVIGRESDFMDLGGHSLLITPLMIEVRQRFQVSFNMREFFGASTLKDLAKLIDSRQESTGGGANASHRTVAQRSEVWARQRMAYLTREAELPTGLAPARGMVYEPVDRIRKLFMTGASGFMGAYLIDEILRTTDAELYCLVRPKRGEEGISRIENQMRHYEVWREDEEWQEMWRSRVHVIDGDVTLPRLGIKGPQYDVLAHEVDAILHGAAHVNFIYPYEALRGTNVQGLLEIIQFAFQGRIKPVHHISTAAIWPMGSEFTFYEKDPIEHGGPLNLGYDEAKWVAEKALLNAAERGLPSVRYRPGEVGGDSVTGRSVLDHFLVASVKGFLQFGAFPDLDIEVDVAPVDYVSQAIAHILFNRKLHGRAYHLTNPHRIHYRAALDLLRQAGYQFEVLRFETLRDRLVVSPGFARNALFAYQAVLEDMDDISLQLPTYDTRETERALRGSSISCPPADEKLFGNYLGYLTGIDFIPRPEPV